MVAYEIQISKFKFEGACEVKRFLNINWYPE